jgi:UDP-2,4-diacetamido-2,4,6-trideoxy-beta-L-altropyranose hydrolase
MTFAVFRCDASPSIGAGHGVRCRTLARTLEKYGWKIAFAASSETFETISGLQESWDFLRLDCLPEEEADALAKHWPEGCGLLVVDHYERDATFEKALRPWASEIMVIDDLADRPHESDILLDQTLGRTPGDYKGLVPAECRLFLGPDYALLAPQFAARRAASLEKRKHGAQPSRILVSFGATDPGNVTGAALDAIHKAAKGAEIDVVLGASAPHLESVLKQVKALGENVSLHVDVKDMAALMALADVAVGAAGTSSWERCALALPSVIVVLADNQRMIAEQLARAGAIAIVAEEEREAMAQSLAQSLGDLCRSQEKRNQMARTAGSLCDGLGALRMAVELGGLRQADCGNSVSLRLMTMDSSSDLPSWLPDVSNGLGRLGVAVSCGATVAGAFWLDLVEDGFEIEFLVNPEKDANQVSRVMQGLARKLLPDENIHPHSGGEAL